MATAAGLDIVKGPMGWGEDVYSIDQLLATEKRHFAALQDAVPDAFYTRAARELPEALRKKWEDFQLAEGREKGSNDLTLLTKFAFGKRYYWLPQDIGSCVWSNTFRPYVWRMIAEICLNGDAEEFFGRDEFSVDSIAPHAITYGFARQIANMRGGDGLYRGPMTEALLKIGVVLCSNPELRKLMDSLGETSAESYPEPRSTRVYKAIGDWKYNDELRPHATCKLLESPVFKSVDEILAAADALKPGFVCSGIAITTKGRSVDGWPIHVQNTRDSWAHNMHLGGSRVDSRGNKYIRVGTESWYRRGDDPEKYSFNVPVEEVARWFARDMVDCGCIGEIDGLKSQIAA